LFGRLLGHKDEEFSQGEDHQIAYAYSNYESKGVGQNFGQRQGQQHIEAVSENLHAYVYQYSFEGFAFFIVLVDKKHREQITCHKTHKIAYRRARGADRGFYGVFFNEKGVKKGVPHIFKRE
jgi:hypothetical protein